MVLDELVEHCLVLLLLDDFEWLHVRSANEEPEGERAETPGLGVGWLVVRVVRHIEA